MVSLMKMLRQTLNFYLLRSPYERASEVARILLVLVHFIYFHTQRTTARRQAESARFDNAFDGVHLINNVITISDFIEIISSDYKQSKERMSNG
jgi:hypothetical protein